MNLRQRTIRAGTWVVASYAVETFTRFFTNLVLTRLLFPEAFGMIAVAMSLITGLQLLTDFGVKAATIRSPRGEDTTFLRTAWTFQSIRGLILWLLLAATCGILSLPSARSVLPSNSVFVNPDFPVVTCVMGLSLILSCCESTALALNARRLDYRPIALLDLVSRMVSILGMVYLAYQYPGVWSIPLGGIAGGLVRLVLSHTCIPGPRMTIAWQKESVKEITSFGAWINVSSIATFFGSQTDILLLGWLLTGPVLGVYYIAKILRDVLENFLEKLNDALTLSVISEVLRVNPTELRNRYYQFRLPIEIIAGVSAGVLFSCSGAIIHFLYDQRYADAGVMLKILSLGLLLYPPMLVRGAFTAIGRADIVAWISIIQALSMAACMGLGYVAAGTLGLMGGIAASRLLPSIALLGLAYKRGWISIWRELRWLVSWPLGYALGTGVAAVLGSRTISDLQHLFTLGQ